MINAQPQRVTRADELDSDGEIWFALRGEGELDDDIASSIDCDTCGARPAWPYDWTPHAAVGTWEWMCDDCHDLTNPEADIFPWAWSGRGPVPPTIYADPGGDDART